MRDDLGKYLANYLDSPYGAESPLIILGHPGSGKSLLTCFLAACLSSKSFTPFRVELRAVNAEAEITAQIREQIGRDTSRDTTWADLAASLDAHPAVVILDGFDELLQASGAVHSGYLQKVQDFQRNETAVRRKPVYAIVTSRITLIDKASIPDGSTVLRLEEFDISKRDQWISLWNTHNQEFFNATGVRPLSLEAASPQVVELARQPLLLLMLAIYDSDGNPLRESVNLNRTQLYYNLLERFVLRENEKSPSFRDHDPKMQKDLIIKDLGRLGVAAIGMFNRQSLHINTQQLDADLSFFNLTRLMPPTVAGRKLSQAELLLGSFFFMHEAQALRKGLDAQTSDAEATFEFLHNTFGEFLAADFLLARIIYEALALHGLRSNSLLQDELHVRVLRTPSCRHWYDLRLTQAHRSQEIPHAGKARPPFRS